MAADALGRKPEPIELPDSPHFVAGIAVRHCVRANQREPILVLVDVVDRNLPAIGVVAQFALRTVLAPMQIRVAVLAFVRRVCEFEIGMAVATAHSRVAAAKGKPRPRMVKLDLLLDHLPIRGGVAGVARHIQLAVRILSRRKRPRRLPMQRAPPQETQQQKKE